MIYLLGANGNIGINISKYLKKKGVKLIGVTRVPMPNKTCYKDFLDIISKKNNSIVINAAILSDNDLKLFINSVPKCTKIIHISSVAVYGNTNLLNKVSPINNYGYLKVKEEEFFLHNFTVFIIRLSNIFGGTPETSGVLKLYNSGKLKFIEVDEENNELIRDFVNIDLLLEEIYDNLYFSKSNIVNVSSGVGMKTSDFFYNLNLNISNIKRQLYDRKNVIKLSIIDSNYKSNY